MTKTNKKRPSGRKLGGFGQKGREDERGRLDFTDYAPDPTLEDEYFGSFRPTTKDFSARSRLDGRYCSDGEFSRGGRGPKGWADDGLWGLTDGQTPQMHQYLVARGQWPRWRKIPPQRAKGNRVNFPFVLRLEQQAEQKLPEVTAPEPDERYEIQIREGWQDRAEDLDRLARRLALLEKPTDPNKGPRWPGDAPPSLSSVRLQPARAPNDSFFARGVLREEKIAILSQRTERAIQKVWCSRYKPSKKLELKRLPTLKRIASNPLLTKDYLARGLRSIKDARRAECELLSAPFLAEGGKVRVCAPEKTAEQIKKTAPKIGRPPIGDRPMTQVERKRRSRPLKNRRGRKPIGPIKKTNAERVRKHRLAKQLRALVAPERPQTGAGQPLPRGRSAPVDLSRKEKK